MPWIMGAAIAGGTLGGAALSSRGASKAANEQKKASRRQVKFQRESLQQQRGDLAPWRSSGQAALDKLNRYYGLSGGAAGYAEKDRGIQPMDIQQFADQVDGYDKQGRIKDWVFKAAPYGLDYYNWAKDVGGVGKKGHLKAPYKARAKQMGITPESFQQPQQPMYQDNVIEQWLMANPNHPQAQAVAAKFRGV